MIKIEYFSTTETFFVLWELFFALNDASQNDDAIPKVILRIAVNNFDHPHIRYNIVF